MDFIWAKRKNRITRLARELDTTGFRGPGRLKNTHPFKGKAPFWCIYDMSFKELDSESRLSPSEVAAGRSGPDRSGAAGV